MKVQIKTRWLKAALATGVALLASCGGVGNGVLPVNAVIQPVGGLEGAKTAKAYTCLNTGISLFVDFNDGQRGDFTNRASYSSSNPAVARVSNFDVPVPEQTNSFYARGTIIAVAPGTATITATYLSFTRTIDITVSDATNFRVTPAVANLAANSRLDLAATADLDGVTTSIDPVVTWAFVAPNSSVANIDSVTGTVSGVAAGSGLTARARVVGCAVSADASVAVANLQSLALTREFGARETLVVGTSERLIATGSLDNGTTQDLTAQVTYSTSDSTAIGLLTSSVPNLALAFRASGPVQLGARFANPAVEAPAVQITPVADSLNSIVLSPASVDVAAGQSTQFVVTGTYASGDTQEITRHVALSSSDGTAAFVQSSSPTVVNTFAGLAATAMAAAGRTVTITAAATSGASQPISSTATLNIR